MNFHEQFKSIQERTLDLGLNFLVDLLGHLDGEALIPRDIDGGVFNFLPLLAYTGKRDDSLEFIEFGRISRSRSLIGIDSSVVPIAESRDGFVLGVKGSIVMEHLDGYEVVRVGPFPIYISLKLVDVYSSLTGFPKGYIKRAAMDIGYAKRFTIDIFEMMLLNNVVENYRDALVLIDGSLVGSFLRYDSSVVKSVYKSGKRNISIVGLSKKSRLLKKYPELYRIVVSYGVPGALKVPNFIIKRFVPFSIFISVFTYSGVPFRVDLVRGDDPNIVLNEIFSSSLSNVGYPEVLKESHILSKISRFELIVLRRVLEAKGARFFFTEKLRDVLFGGFNRWGGGNESV